MDVKFIPLSVPNLKGNELKYVSHAIETEWVSTAGSYVTDFETSIARYVGAAGAVSCQNGTSGLHTALLALGVTGDDAVLVPALTFIAAVNPVKYIGAEPIFMDCDDSLCMDADKLRDFCENACDFVDGQLISKHSGRRIKALVLVHVFGNMADMPALLAVAERYKLRVVEDATEALGTYYTEGPYKGKYAGTMGDVGVYSFNGNKIITTGGGGMIVSQNSELLARAKHLTTQAKADEVYFRHDEIGYNYRMTNLQAAMGLAQLEQLESFIAVKTENYRRYKEAVAALPGLELLRFRDGIRPNYWFYSLFVGAGFSRSRDEVIQRFSANKIQTRPIWWLIHEQPMYQQAQAWKIEKARHYWAHIVNIPCSSNLSAGDVARVVEVLKGMTE